ncbi:hypothetical protein C8Q74DRAFT_369980 [Fomes fomentarius]|nr:hypothetical protein C8Q74DRAFT_369980 [Fomes fomentarius]
MQSPSQSLIPYPSKSLILHPERATQSTAPSESSHAQLTCFPIPRDQVFSPDSTWRQDNRGDQQETSLLIERRRFTASREFSYRNGEPVSEQDSYLFEVSSPPQTNLSRSGPNQQHPAIAPHPSVPPPTSYLSPLALTPAQLSPTISPPTIPAAALHRDSPSYSALHWQHQYFVAMQQHSLFVTQQLQVNTHALPELYATHSRLRAPSTSSYALSSTWSGQSSCVYAPSPWTQGNIYGTGSMHRTHRQMQTPEHQSSQLHRTHGRGTAGSSFSRQAGTSYDDDIPLRNPEVEVEEWDNDDPQAEEQERGCTCMCMW